MRPVVTPVTPVTPELLPAVPLRDAGEGGGGGEDSGSTGAAQQRRQQQQQQPARQAQPVPEPEPAPEPGLTTAPEAEETDNELPRRLVVARTVPTATKALQLLFDGHGDRGEVTTEGAAAAAAAQVGLGGGLRLSPPISSSLSAASTFGSVASQQRCDRLGELGAATQAHAAAVRIQAYARGRRTRRRLQREHGIDVRASKSTRRLQPIKESAGKRARFTSRKLASIPQQRIVAPVIDWIAGKCPPPPLPPPPPP
eukprot:COSAG01_NODE_6057_length_3876_cov_2.004766_6_plen_254_part_01